MAANDYYDSQSIRSIQRRHEAPLPPLPPSVYDHPDPSQSTISPISSPFDDSNRIYGHHSEQNFGSNYGYHGASGGGFGAEHSPYADDIPLNNHKSKGSIPDNPAYNPRGMGMIPDQDPRSQVQQRKRRFFRGKTPWVVYLLTAIQIIVFIVELAKNGEH